MSGRLYLFVSATNDLETEREIIGQAVASLPVDLGWVIKRTPAHGEPLQRTIEAIQRSDFYVLLLGADITAPVGLELVAAQRVAKKPLAYLKQGVIRTPAGQAFLQAARVDWMRYSDLQELQRHFQEHLTQRLLDHALEYRLTPVEYETLQGFLEELRGEKQREEAEEERRGAGGGGVIISPSRDIPRGGVPVEGPKPGQK